MSNHEDSNISTGSITQLYSESLGTGLLLLGTWLYWMLYQMPC